MLDAEFSGLGEEFVDIAAGGEPDDSHPIRQVAGDSRALVPMEPVEPRMTTRLGAGGGEAAGVMELRPSGSTARQRGR